jgi:hypothetical protein
MCKVQYWFRPVSGELLLGLVGLLNHQLNRIMQNMPSWICFKREYLRYQTSSTPSASQLQK